MIASIVNAAMKTKNHAMFMLMLWGFQAIALLIADRPQSMSDWFSAIVSIAFIYAMQYVMVEWGAHLAGRTSLVLLLALFCQRLERITSLDV